MLNQCYFKLNYIRTLLICPKMAYSCCFSLRGNLDFLQNKFYNIDYRLKLSECTNVSFFNVKFYLKAITFAPRRPLRPLRKRCWHHWPVPLRQGHCIGARRGPENVPGPDPNLWRRLRQEIELRSCRQQPSLSRKMSHRPVSALSPDDKSKLSHFFHVEAFLFKL